MDYPVAATDHSVGDKLLGWERIEDRLCEIVSVVTILLLFVLLGFACLGALVWVAVTGNKRLKYILDRVRIEIP